MFVEPAYDSAIWSTFQVKRKLEQIFMNGVDSSWLIGDLGYTLQPSLIIHFLDENLTESQAFTNQQRML